VVCRPRPSGSTRTSGWSNHRGGKPTATAISTTAICTSFGSSDGRARSASRSSNAASCSTFRDRSRASADVKALAQARVSDIERKIEELMAMKATLEHLIERCHGDDRPECPILEDLAGAISKGNSR
jgi:hypothetical protein